MYMYIYIYYICVCVCIKDNVWLVMVFVVYMNSIILFNFFTHPFT